MNNVNRFLYVFRGLSRDSISKLSLLVSAAIFIFSACLLVIIAIGFALGVALAKWQFLLALLPAFFILYFFTGSYFKENQFGHFLIISVVFILLLAASISISNIFYDLSWDGQAYHQETIIRLTNGWNPFYNSFPNDAPYAIWAEHYPKAGEMMAASLYKLTGSIEAGKAFNLLFICASFFVSLSLMLAFKKIPKIIAVSTAVIIAMNPVSVYQALSFYIDGLLGSVIASFIAVSILIYIKPDRVLGGLFFGLLLIIVNLKFTAVIYAMIFIAGLGLALLISKKMETLKKVCMGSCLGFLAGVFIIGFNPYFTNTLAHQHPFYPIFGPNKIDIGITGNTPVYFRSMNRLQSMVCSILSQSENHLPGEKLKLKIPFTITNEKYWFACADVRTGGFGPLFSGAVTLFLIFLTGYSILLMRKQELEKMKWAAYLILVLFISVIVNPVTWWARYIPQLWLIPVCIIPLLAASNYQVLKVGNYLLVGVFLFNILIVGSVNLQSNLHNTQALKQQLQRIAAQNKIVDVYFGSFDSNRVRFEKMGIQYREFKEEKELGSDGKTEEIIWSTARVRMPLE